MVTSYLLDTETADFKLPLHHFAPEKKTSDWSVVIFAGGGYHHRAVHEGEGYAEFLSQNGFHAFVADYRVAPDFFPAPLFDARRAMRYVRAHSEEFGINKNKIAVMGSSAGGHLAALVTNCREVLEGEGKDEIYAESYVPNAHILCYPVISLIEPYGHLGSGKNLLGEQYEALSEALSVQNLVSDQTPPAFVWHAFGDPVVSILNSLEYVKALKACEISAEYHLWPEGKHGMGLAAGKDDPVLDHISQWGGLLLSWLNTLDGMIERK